ncbi:hypothetical protein [Shewanella marisflavi]|uniref:Uncharacterized protein n=1 Tax=Shewanella marisflavi TaxID=260364 RepID=A0AAC9TXT7_9GAMM|nr:hypothetical protein [Shewanella marisflavi]ASJ95748.1 hypothetical protein CFF01_03595 [Shewanella marisflavi]
MTRETRVAKPNSEPVPNPETVPEIAPELAQRLAPYAAVQLSAFDNLKLLTALATQAELDCESIELHRDGRAFYALNWQECWLDCGYSNDYAAKITPMCAPSEQMLAVARKVEVPVLNAQQLSFMCMEYSHFDHC